MTMKLAVVPSLKVRGRNLALGVAAQGIAGSVRVLNSRRGSDAESQRRPAHELRAVRVLAMAHVCSGRGPVMDMHSVKI